MFSYLFKTCIAFNLCLSFATRLLMSSLPKSGFTMDPIIDGETVLPGVFCTTQLVNISTGGDFECSGDSNDSHEISISVKCRRIKGGEWETSFVTNRNTSHQSRNIDVDVTRKITKGYGECTVEIGGFVRDTHQEEKVVPDYHKERTYNGLTFKKSSESAVITNNGRSLKKTEISAFGSGVTNKPLLDDKIFTVRIDKKEGIWNWGPAIGVTALTLNDQELEDHLNNYESGTWMFYGTNVFQNGTNINSNYLKDLQFYDIKEGDTIGVMRSRLGDLYLFINGVSQGLAASNIPKPVYGVFELFGSLKEATIMDV